MRTRCTDSLGSGIYIVCVCMCILVYSEIPRCQMLLLFHLFVGTVGVYTYLKKEQADHSLTSLLFHHSLSSSLHNRAKTNLPVTEVIAVTVGVLYCCPKVS